MRRVFGGSSLFVLLPYLAVLVGLYGYRSAWFAAGLYYGGAIILISARLGKQSFVLITSGWSWKGAVLSIAFAVTLVLAALILWKPIQRDDVTLREIFTRYGLGGAAGILFCGVVLLVNPLIEELFWRGCYPSDPRRWSWIDMLFAGYHLPVLCLVARWYWLVVFLVGLALFAWMMRYLRHTLRGLATAWFAHEMADLAILLSILWIVNHP
jgi:hypothetical protein